MIKFYKLILIPAVIIILMGLLAGFDSPKEDKHVQDLISKRVEILEQAFYGKISEEIAIKRLKEIETYPLFNKDVNSIKTMVETEIDTVRAIEFSGIEETVKMFTYLSYNMNITWTMRSLQGDYRTMGRYTVVMKNSDGIYKLSEFQHVT